MKKIRQIVNPKNFKHTKQTELVDIDYNGKEYEYDDENYEERNKWDKDSYEYHKYLEQHAQENIRIQIESILSEKFLFNQLKISDTTILDYYYAIRPYIENLKYKNLLSGIDTPEEIKTLNEKTKDARKLPKEKQQLIRYEAIKLLEAGELSIKGIARKLGVHSSRIYEWRNLYKKRQEKYNNATELIKEGRLSVLEISKKLEYNLKK